MKDKAILVIDMPECCRDCPYCKEMYEVFECRITQKIVDKLDFYPYDHKMDTCPLQLVPEKSLTGNSDYFHWGDWEDGWNQCIDRILGGESDDD